MCRVPRWRGKFASKVKKQWRDSSAHKSLQGLSLGNDWSANRGVGSIQWQQCRCPNTNWWKNKENSRTVWESPQLTNGTKRRSTRSRTSKSTMTAVDRSLLGEKIESLFHITNQNQRSNQLLLAVVPRWRGKFASKVKKQWRDSSAHKSLQGLSLGNDWSANRGVGCIQWQQCQGPNTNGGRTKKIHITRRTVWESPQ